jgi:hypothetical protein
MPYQPNKTIALIAIAAIALSSVPVAPSMASIIPTDRIIAQQTSAEERARVNAFIAREDVQTKLETYGVEPAEAASRVAALSDAEVADLASRIDRLPAGQDAIGTVVGAALVVFIVLLITDIACLTRVFPFTRCAVQ